MVHGLRVRAGIGPARTLEIVVLVVASITACTEAPPPEPGAPVLAEVSPAPRASDGLPESPELQDVLELQLRRDGEGLTERLRSESSLVRARAALALGSVQWPGAASALTALLADPEPSVRADAAFALGQLPSSGAGAALFRAFVEEEVERVRERIIEALGKGGDAAAIERLAGEDTGSLEGPRARALARALLRGAGSPAVRSELVSLLAHEDAGAREAAAYYLLQAGDPDLWAEHLGTAREAWDAAALSDPMAMYLVPAIAQHRAPEDRERILHWLGNAEDWRIRANTARALGSLSWIEREGVREALFRALEDPVEQVAIVAAESLTRGLWVPPAVLARMEAILRDDAIERWRIHAKFIQAVGQFGDGDAVLSWTRRAFETPLALAHGLAALSQTRMPVLRTLVSEAIDHPDPEIHNVGVSALVGAWQTMVLMGADPEEDLYPPLLQALEEGSAPAAAYAASALTHPTFAELGGDEAVYDEARRRLERGEVSAVALMASALTELGDPRGAELSVAVDRAIVNASPDWGLLSELGPHPLLRIETSQGEIVARVSAEQAPLTVQTLAVLSSEGRYDGVPFHRLEPNFLIQGGDIGMGDGSGTPEIRLPSEFTTIPFRRGTLGMASRGKDTEGAQFFILHSRQPHLDGEFTAFGWVESGFDVLDRLGAGDRVIGIQVEVDPERTPRG